MLTLTFFSEILVSGLCVCECMCTYGLTILNVYIYMHMRKQVLFFFLLFIAKCLWLFLNSSLGVTPLFHSMIPKMAFVKKPILASKNCSCFHYSSD